MGPKLLAKSNFPNQYINYRQVSHARSVLGCEVLFLLSLVNYDEIKIFCIFIALTVEYATINLKSW